MAEDHDVRPRRRDRARRLRQWLSPARGTSLKSLVVVWLVCLPIAYFFVQLTWDVPIRNARTAAAAFGWHGERGTVTVTHTDTTYDGRTGKRHHCVGDFRPDGGGDVVTDVRLHLDGPCDQGRTAEARLLREDTGSWLMPDEGHDAYAGTGTGVGEPLLVLVFMGAFCLLVGAPFVLCAVVVPVSMVLTVRGRAA